MRAGRAALLALVCAAAAAPVHAQGYRLRLDARAQAVSYRGVTADSVLASSTSPGTGGGPVSPDGHAVDCLTGATYCHFFRPGPERRGGPLVTSADLTMWGFGVTGLSLRLNTRLGVDLGDSDVWPGTDPAVQLVEAYAEYAAERYTVRAGRQVAASRLGVAVFDGGSAIVRQSAWGLEAGVYAGWGLGQASVLPITSPALNPLDDYRPDRRQVTAGGHVGWSTPWFDSRVDYEREVDPRSDYFVSERVGFNADIHPIPRWSVVGGAEYDMAQGWWGSADASLRYTSPLVTVLGGYRRYRPHFDLWTIWGAFSPVPYNAVEGAAWVRPIPELQVRVRGERYWFQNTETTTPLVVEEDRGWRVGFGGTWEVSPRWSVDAGYHAEFGPGASSRGYDASVTYTPDPRISVTAFGSTLNRPLEFRFSDAEVRYYGLDAAYSPLERLRLSAGVARAEEDRNRPDAGSLDWNQWRVNARVTLYLDSGADRLRLPPAIRRPGAGS